ncbi:MAG: alpha/beta hydrolase [Paracoccaceae bacterium]|nr:MAG: alpha/beta hydrolase [Paracoccaceae bacterium]
MPFRSEADRAYANGAFIPGAEAYPLRWAVAAQEFRHGLGARARLGLAYGPGERQRFDLFLPPGDPRGLLVFVHGGYWLAFGRETWSHLAAGAVARGWACAMPSYTLAPEARISAMTQEVAGAVRAASGLVPGPVVVTGHSAGGQLSARMGCAGIDLPRVARVVPVSPLADLAPLMATEMNDRLHIDAAEAAAESPAGLPLRAGVQAHVWVGGQERPAFLWQARLLSEAWDCPWTVDPGRHHFDVIDGLADPEGGLTRACLDGF